YLTESYRQVWPTAPKPLEAAFTTARIALPDDETSQKTLIRAYFEDLLLLEAWGLLAIPAGKTRSDILALPAEDIATQYGAIRESVIAAAQTGDAGFTLKTVPDSGHDPVRFLYGASRNDLLRAMVDAGGAD
ncbi:MAG: hypothetical protein AAFX02_03905, partial [Pseudomonadota bacterium]